MNNKIELLQKMINESNKIIFFGGAGVSTDSGIKDFRGKNGLYKEKYKFPPEYMLSKNCFYNNTKDFFKYYKEKLNCLNANPNETHLYLKKLEDSKKLLAIITQNIDGLHQKAGSKNILELHGTIYENHCIKCGKKYNAEKVFNSIDIPKCNCGGIIKPDVVLYGESLPYCFIDAEVLISKCDMLIVCGTSLTVMPASELVKLYTGNKLVIINNSETSYDKFAALVIHDNIKNVFSKLKI